MKRIKKIINNLKFFDYLVILSLLLLGIFIFISLFRKSTYVEIVLKIYREEWFLKQLKIGMSEKNIIGEKMAEIQSIKSYPTSDQKKWIHLKIKLKVIYSPGENTYVYKGKKILVGSYLDIYTDNLLIDGTIIRINDLNFQDIYQIKAKARIINLDPAFPNTEGINEYLTNTLKENQIMKDSLGFPAIRIEKKQVEDAKMVTVDLFGQTHLTTNPLRKDVYLDLTIWAEKIGQYYYLFGDENFPIIIGNSIPFTINNTWVFFTITQIMEINKYGK